MSDHEAVCNAYEDDRDPCTCTADDPWPVWVLSLVVGWHVVVAVLLGLAATA